MFIFIYISGKTTKLRSLLVDSEWPWLANCVAVVAVVAISCYLDLLILATGPFAEMRDECTVFLALSASIHHLLSIRQGASLKY